MGTFGTNRLYTVGRVVKVEYLMRFGGWLRAGSNPSVSQMQKFISIVDLYLYPPIFAVTLFILYTSIMNIQTPWPRNVNHGKLIGKTGVTADRDKIEFRLFNSSSIFNVTLCEELLSSLKQKTIMPPCPVFMALVTWSSLERS